MFYVFQVQGQVFLNQDMPIIMSLIVHFRSKTLTELGSRGSFKENYQIIGTLLSSLHSLSWNYLT